MNTYNLFLSHSWKHNHQYGNLETLLRARPYFNFRNYSVPEHNPIVRAQTDAQLEAAIEAKIRPCSVVVILAGVYATYSKWINKEIQIAQRLGKPILAVKPFGNTMMSTVVRNAAHGIANWNTESIVSEIRRLA